MSTSTAPRGFALACIAGQGHVLLNDRWEICRAGEAYLCPKGTPRAYRAVPGHHWEFVWTIYATPPRWMEHLSPFNHLISYDQALPLSSAVEGLYREVNGPNDHSFSAQWASLISSYWNATSKGGAGGRLQFLWEKVDDYLVYPWTLRELSCVAGVSQEHLRRICLNDTGMSPIKHLTPA